jgi:hypothetical protein
LHLKIKFKEDFLKHLLDWTFRLLLYEYIDVSSVSGSEAYLAKLIFSKLMRLAKDLKIKITLPFPKESVYARISEMFLPGNSKFWNDSDYSIMNFLVRSIVKAAGHYNFDYLAELEQSIPFSNDAVCEFIVKTTLFNNHCPKEFLLTQDQSKFWASPCLRKKNYLILVLYNLKKATPEQLALIDWNEFINRYKFIY